MDPNLNSQISANGLNFQRTLDRIIDKYSKLHHQDASLEVELNNTSTNALESQMKRSRTKLRKLESKSLTDVSDQSLRAQEITRNSQWDFTQDGGSDETRVSSFNCSENNEITRNNVTELTVSSFDESLKSFSEVDLQPEDQDEELESTLRSHSRSLMELYPSMISRIERAWQRQHVSDAADSVLRRYRRWRQQPNKSYLNDTLSGTARPSKPKRMTSKQLLKETPSSPEKIQLRPSDVASRIPLQVATSRQDWRALERSPGRSREQQQQQPVLVMDFTGSPETLQPIESFLNETFDVPQVDRQYSVQAVSPQLPVSPVGKAFVDLSLRSKRLSLSAHSVQTEGCSVYTPLTAVKERPGIYSSPLRQSPLKARMMSSLSRSSQPCSRSPRARPMEIFARRPPRPRSLSPSLSSPPLKPAMPLRMLHPHNSRHSSHSPSAQSRAAAAGSSRSLRRHLSFDSSLPSYSPKKIDEDFVKLYHKFVCQNKSSSFFNSPPCRFCNRSSEASRGRSSSALAALALSPHRLLLRKRHREVDWESHPLSKRSREQYHLSSPRSKHCDNRMLRRRLIPSEYERLQVGLLYSPSKHGVFQKFRAQQESDEGPEQELWMRQSRYVSTVDSSGLRTGRMLESQMTDGYSPRKW
ncbi:uncharacterized protein V6R79_006204 [Siganus canaliculatus]